MAPEAFAAAGVEPRGELWVGDARHQGVLGRPRPPPRPRRAHRDAILANPLYENITARFVQSHDYIAMERLHELHSSGRYDLIVVDTPPTRNALDFLDAPARMAEFFGGRLLRWLTVPYRSRSIDRGVAALLHHGRPHPRRAVPAGHRRVLHPLPDDGEGLRRAGPGRQPLLADERTTFWSSRRSSRRPLREAEFFIDELHGASCTSARSCSTRCCPRTSSTPPRRRRHQ